MTTSNGHEIVVEEWRQRVFQISVTLFSFGVFLSVLAYGEFFSALVGILALGVGLFLLSFRGMARVEERLVFVLVFSICWFWSGVAATYVQAFSSQPQIGLDANRFFWYSSNAGLAVFSFQEIAFHTEGVGAIMVWRFLYETLSEIGLPHSPYIGIAVNGLSVSLSAFFGAKIVRLTFGEDLLRIKRYVWIVSTCGILWLFAAIHLRDSFILLIFTILLWAWIRLLAQPSVVRLVHMGGVTLISLPIFLSLRREFVFLPLGLIVMGVFSFVVAGSRDIGKVRTPRALILFLLLSPVIAYFIYTQLSGIMEMITMRREAYMEMSYETSGDGSLGNRLVVNQPIFIRFFVAPIYMLVFPIPFWVGFFEASPYHLFKSLNVVYMYAVAPLFIFGAWRVLTRKDTRNPQTLFLTVVSLMMLQAVALTSLETRHLGAFMIPIMLVALIPDLNSTADRRIIRGLLTGYIGAITIIHLSWVAIKFL